MTTFFRYTFTAPFPDGRTGTVIASDTKSARQKAWSKLIVGTPFLSYPSNKITVVQGLEIKMGQS